MKFETLAWDSVLTSRLIHSRGRMQGRRAPAKPNSVGRFQLSVHQTRLSPKNKQLPESATGGGSVKKAKHALAGAKPGSAGQTGHVSLGTIKTARRRSRAPGQATVSAKVVARQWQRAAPKVNSKTVRRHVRVTLGQKNKYYTQAKKGSAQGGGWGGYYTCPDGTSYLVGDNNNGCGSLAGSGGRSGGCNKKWGAWSGNKVVCGKKVPNKVKTNKSPCRRFAPNGKELAWSARDPSAAAGCKCKDGWRDAQCSTEESYGTVAVQILKGWDFGNGMDEEEEELQLKDKARSKVGSAGDPFCKVTVNGHSFTTKRKDSTNNPYWADYRWISGSAFNTKNAIGYLECWDWDRWSANDLYGKGAFYIQNGQASYPQGYYYTVHLYNGVSGSKYAGRNPKVKVFVGVNRASRLGTQQKLPMVKSWFSHGKTTFPKSKEAGDDCIVRAMSGEDLNGKELQVTNVPRCKTRSVIYSGYVTGKVSSFKLSEGCEKVKLWDQDGCRENYSDNRVITRNARYGRRRRRFNNQGSGDQEVNWDLNDDVCGITVTGKCG